VTDVVQRGYLSTVRCR